MSVKYKVKQWVSPYGNYNGMYFARAMMTGSLDLADIADLIQRNCSMKKSDVNAVLTEMVDVITDALQDSKKVHIDGLGTFKMGLRTHFAITKDEFTPANIYGLKVQFIPEYTIDSNGERKTVLISGAKVEEYSQYDRGVNDNART